MCAWTKIAEYHKRYSAKEIAATIGVYENLKYNLSQCKYVSHLLLLLLFVSYYYNRYRVYNFFCHDYRFEKIFFMLFDRQEKTLIMIDSRPVKKWCKDTPMLIYASKLLDLTCSTWPQWMYIGLDGTKISSNENSSVKKILQMTLVPL